MAINCNKGGTGWSAELVLFSPCWCCCCCCYYQSEWTRRSVPVRFSRI